MCPILYNVNSQATPLHDINKAPSFTDDSSSFPPQAPIAPMHRTWMRSASIPQYLTLQALSRRGRDHYENLDASY